jgi:hypothetical protein
MKDGWILVAAMAAAATAGTILELTGHLIPVWGAILLLWLLVMMTFTAMLNVSSR